MGRRVCTVIAATVVVIGASVRPSDANERIAPPSPASSLALVSSLDARSELIAAAPEGSSGSASEETGTGAAKVFLLSLAVPGSGQMVRGEKRGYLYLAVELAFWGSFFVLDNQGLDERDEYEAFADDSWDYSAYADWYEENCMDCEDCAEDYDCRPLAEHGTQEYYEDIGKYAAYWRWWNIDGDEGEVAWDEYSRDDLATRDLYWDMRADSNTHLRQARYFMTAAFLNHLVSAADAFLSSRRDEHRGESSHADLRIEFDVPDTGEGLACALVARY